VSTGSRRAVVLAGGDPIDPADVELPAGAFVIAADSGVHLAQRLGVSVDVVVGDLDSARPEAVAAAAAGGARVERHPVAKDATDLELALELAAGHGCRDLLVVGIGGGRVDHFLANLLALAAPRFAGLHIDGVSSDARVAVIHDARELSGAAGEIVTLLALGGPARGVRTTGLVFPLRGETLHPGSTRGVSNVFEGTRATVTVESGTLIAVQPRGAREERGQRQEEEVR
jgi:thiamine pyrophosphokinase